MCDVFKITLGLDNTRGELGSGDTGPSLTQAHFVFNLNLGEVGRVQPPFLTEETVEKRLCSLLHPVNIGKFSFPPGILTFLSLCGFIPLPFPPTEHDQ